MKNKELQNFKTYHLNLGSEEKFAAKVKILYDRLIDNLMLLPEKETQLVILENFKQCILNINNFEDEIGTAERESVLEHIYAIGEIVGLDPTSEYAEEWRGDW